MSKNKRILTDEELQRIKMVNDSPQAPHGRPVKLIGELLDTIYHLKLEKKKWQHLADKRKRLCTKAIEILNGTFTNSEEIND